MQADPRVTSGPDAGRAFDRIKGIPMVIGRGEKSNTRLTDGMVSRLDCELRWQGINFMLIDHESVGGTFVDGRKIKEHSLKHDEEFQIGGPRPRLYTTGNPDAQTPFAAQKPAREPTLDEGALTGRNMSHYEVGPALRKGRTGTIDKARDSRDGKDVAFKVPHSDFTSDEEDIQRFVRAMTPVVGLHHPNLIGLYDTGKQGWRGSRPNSSPSTVSSWPTSPTWRPSALARMTRSTPAPTSTAWAPPCMSC